MTIATSVCSKYSVKKDDTVCCCPVYIIGRKFAPNQWVAAWLSVSMGSASYTLSPWFVEVCISWCPTRDLFPLLMLSTWSGYIVPYSFYATVTSLTNRWKNSLDNFTSQIFLKPVSLEHNDTFEIIDLATVEEILPLSFIDSLTSKSPPSYDKRRTPATMCSLDYAQSDSWSNRNILTVIFTIIFYWLLVLFIINMFLLRSTT